MARDRHQAPVYRPVATVEAIELDRHGFIEASAGTGKTYTIEHLVLRLLKERDELQLEEILLVTYTEKAAGELKARIRDKIEAALAEGEGADCATAETGLTGNQALKLRSALDSFDAANIHTIHGFCHRVLSDYAFENRMPFETEVVDDGPIYTEQLRELMRRHWPAEYGGDLQLLLHLAGFAGREPEFSARTTAIAAHLYRPELGDRILPPPSTAAIGDLLSRARSELGALLAALRPTDVFLEGYARLNFNAAARRKRLAEILTPLAALAGEEGGAEADLNRFADWYLLAQRVKSGQQRGIDAIMPDKWLKAGPNLEACPRLETVVAHLETLGAILGELQYRLQIEAVASLQAAVPRIKNRKGWISYNDMLSRVAAALRGPGGQRLAETLRRRFKVAFVDEFQDTDPVQWQIFARLFLDDHPPRERAGQLFLIGDPKQAIYGFRGADVFAYLSARRRMEALAAKGRAGLYCLATNWRSSAELVAAFNRLFGQAPWFPPAGAGGPFTIGYQPVLAPPPEQIKLPLAADDSGRGALNLIDLRGEESLRRAKYRLPDLIAAEIQHLVADSRLLLGSSEGQPGRRLGYGDIGILIRGRSEAILMERALQRRQIPYAYYKKPGLFQSAEAWHLSLVLHAIADPQSQGSLNAALLSPFFDLQPAQLAGDGGLPDNHPIRRMLGRWHELALGGRWSRLFDALFGESGVLFRQAVTPQWDRFESNCSQLRTYLQQAAYEKNLDLRGLTALLDTQIEGTRPAQPEADLHQIDTEAPKVQLMTMHVSKGLQFPIVFVAGGLTQPARGGVTVYHQRGEGTEAHTVVKVIDLTGASGKEAHAQEALEEDKRLLYVALTRARLKLYLPFYRPDKLMSWVGPVGRILAPALAAAFDPDGAEKGRGGDAIGAVSWLPPEAMRPAPSPVAGAAPKAPAATPAARVAFPPQPVYGDRRPAVASFTRLHRAAQESPSPGGALGGFAVAEGSMAGAGGRAADEAHGEGDATPAGSLDSGASLHPADRLPGGARMGSLLHDILEQIDYGAVRSAPRADALDAECCRLIEGLMRRHQVDPVWQAGLAALVWNTLSTPIPCAEGTLVLGDLAPTARLHEPEFYCHLEGPAAAGAREGHGYLRGFVDLLFQHDGRYYILDWKSNRLAQGYAPDALAASMAAADYHLQYRIYTLATLRWLSRRLGPAFDPRTHFGGVYYIYLRGMGRGPGSGVFYAPPEEIGAEAELERALRRQLEVGHGR